MNPPTAERPLLRLVQGTLAGPALAPDPGDFDAVFRHYAPYVARVGLRLLGAESELDDLVQEVFMEAHRGLGGLREPGALRGWLTRICVRRATRRLRQRRLRVFLSLEAVSDAELPLDASASPELAAEVAALYRRLSRMASKERVVWVLKHVEGESLDEIAFLCDCSKSTVQRRLRSAEAHFESEAAP
jgi:RNA polymerase sigma-70 factor (ECF subfamily)